MTSLPDEEPKGIKPSNLRIDRSEGFALALDEDADLVLAMDRRGALELAAADSFAAWMEALVCAVRAVRERFAEKFPVGEEV